MKLNVPMVRLLVAKDWHLFRKQLAFFVVAGIVALGLLGLARPWSFYLGSFGLIVIMVAVACFSVATSLMEERKQQTLAFVMSLPVSPLDFTVAKLAGNLLTFGVPFGVMSIGTAAVVLSTPLPDGLFVYSLLVYGWILFAYCIALSVAMSVESEGWNIFAMIASSVMINPFIMVLSQIPAINDRVREDAIAWSPEAVAILSTLVLLGLLVLGLTTLHHARKPAFY